jgi:hypothetical protein
MDANGHEQLILLTARGCEREFLTANGHEWTRIGVVGGEWDGVLIPDS